MPSPIVPPEINQPSRPAPLIVGRDPGAEEVARGKPFVGPSGSLLFGGWDPVAGQQTQGAIARAGLTRQDVNITNLVLKRPWNNDFFRHTSADIKEGERELRALIESLRPSIIIAHGNEVAYSLIPSYPTLTDRHYGEMSGGRSIKSATGILDRRGFLWYPEETGLPCPIIITLHPSSCLYQPMPHRMLMEIDYARAGAVLRGDLPRQHFPTPTRIRTAADMEPIWDSPLVAYDIEIKWGGDAFLCIAFATSDGRSYLAYEDAFRATTEWLRSDRPKLAHNSQFDRYFIEHRMGVPVGGRHEDTICAHWACYPELAGKKDTGRETQKKGSKNEMTRKGLNFLASFHLNYPWWKTYTSDPSLMGQLCSNDVVATMEAWHVIEPEIESMKVRKQYERQLSKLPALISIQAKGFLVDEALRSERVALLTERQSTLENESRLLALAYLHSLGEAGKRREDGSEWWWYHAAQCPCCGGGSRKRDHCPMCARVKGTGSGGSITKSDLVLALWRSGGDPATLKRMKRSDLEALLPPCKECSGAGTIDTWDFNPMSSTQMPALLFDLLGVPKYTYRGKPDASEETLKSVLEWAEKESNP